MGPLNVKWFVKFKKGVCLKCTYYGRLKETEKKLELAYTCDNIFNTIYTLGYQDPLAVKEIIWLWFPLNVEMVCEI